MPDQGSSATPRRHLKVPIASYHDEPSPQKIELISCESMTHISDIKLIRTDTTLDLSQKAEKGMLFHMLCRAILFVTWLHKISLSKQCGTKRASIY